MDDIDYRHFLTDLQFSAADHSVEGLASICVKQCSGAGAPHWTRPRDPNHKYRGLHLELICYMADQGPDEKSLKNWGENSA